MDKGRNTTVIAIMAVNDSLQSVRTELVRLPRGADNSLFRGWGVRI
jgi:hypothetical protein